MRPTTTSFPSSLQEMSMKSSRVLAAGSALSLSIALAGFWHVHAQDYASQVRATPGTELVAAWDDDPDRGRP